MSKQDTLNEQIDGIIEEVILYRNSAISKDESTFLALMIWNPDERRTNGETQFILIQILYIDIKAAYGFVSYKLDTLWSF